MDALWIQVRQLRALIGGLQSRFTDFKSTTTGFLNLALGHDVQTNSDMVGSVVLGGPTSGPYVNSVVAGENGPHQGQNSVILATKKAIGEARESIITIENTNSGGPLGTVIRSVIAGQYIEGTTVAHSGIFGFENYVGGYSMLVSGHYNRAVGSDCVALGKNHWVTKNNGCALGQSCQPGVGAVGIVAGVPTTGTLSSGRVQVPDGMALLHGESGVLIYTGAAADIECYKRPRCDGAADSLEDDALLRADDLRQVITYSQIHEVFETSVGRSGDFAWDSQVGLMFNDVSSAIPIASSTIPAVSGLHVLQYGPFNGVCDMSVIYTGSPGMRVTFYFGDDQPSAYFVGDGPTITADYGNASYRLIRYTSHEVAPRYVWVSTTGGTGSVVAKLTVTLNNTNPPVI
jgi:hypothetical protein